MWNDFDVEENIEKPGLALIHRRQLPFLLIWPRSLRSAAVCLSSQALSRCTLSSFEVPDDVADRPFEDDHVVFIEGLLQGVDQAIGPLRIDDGHGVSRQSPPACSGAGRHAVRGILEIVGLDMGDLAVAVVEQFEGVLDARDC